MSRKHGKKLVLGNGIKPINDYTKSNSTRNNFKKWIKEASYKEVIEMFEIYKIKLMKYKTNIAKSGNLYALVPGTKMENMKIVKYKYNLLCNKINMELIKHG